MYVSFGATGGSPGAGSGAGSESVPGPAVDRAAGRLEQLPWSAWHRSSLLRCCGVSAVAGLLWGAAWSSPTALVGGACVGALVLGRLADRFGRRQLLLISLAVSVLAGGAAPFTGPAWLAGAWVGVVGFGTGGALAATAAGVAELAPARLRGRWVQVVVASCWLGAAAGAALRMALPVEQADAGTLPGGPHLVTGLAASAGLVALVAARKVPESPRWLRSRGRVAEANLVVAQAERLAGAGTTPTNDDASGAVDGAAGATPARVPSGVGVQRPSLLVPPALVVGTVVLPTSVTWGSPGVGVTSDALAVAVLAAGGFLGPVTLGHLADSAGRRWVVLAAYLAAGLALAGTAGLVVANAAPPLMVLLGGCAVVSLASTGLGAMLTAAVETAPLDRRATTAGVSVALVAVAVVAPAGGALTSTVTGWFAVSALLAAGAVLAWRLPGEGARRPLEQTAPPAGVPAREEPEADGRDAPVADLPAPRRRRPAPATHRTVRSGYATWTSTTTLPGDHPRRVADVARLLQALGAETLARPELEAKVGTSPWQPGRFRVALRTALEAGQVVEVAPGRFARAEHSPRTGD